MNQFFTREMKYSFFFFSLVIMISILLFGRYQRDLGHGGDSWGYYVYLPASFISHDITTLDEALKYREENFRSDVYHDSKGNPRVEEAPYRDGIQSIKYTYGVSLFYLPAFMLSHAVALLTSFPANGFSLPYTLGLFLITAIYVLCGMFYLGKLLRRYFSENIVILTLATLLLATNLYYFTVYNNIMSHPILFFLWSVLLYNTDRYVDEYKRSNFLWIAFCVGMITIIRPVEVIALAIPFLYKVQSFDQFRKRIHQIFNDKSSLLLGVLIGVSTIIPQLIYWKVTTGHWVYDSYPQETFDFFNSQIVKGLFGFLNGWIPYSPIMLFSLIGLIIMLYKRVHNSILILSIFILYTYVIYSWWNWYYINGFGSRPMVDIYPLLAMPLAVCYSSVSRKYFKLFIAMFIVLASLNIFQTYQISKGIMLSEIGNRAYYIQCLGATKFNKEISMAVDMNTVQPKNIAIIDTLYHENFDEKDAQNAVLLDEKRVYQVSNEDASEPIVLKYDYIMKSGHSDAEYITYNMDVMVKNQGGSFYNFDYMVFKFERPNGKQYNWRHLRLNNKTGKDGEYSFGWGEPDVWTNIEGHLKLPRRFKKGHLIKIEFGKGNNPSTVFVDNLLLSTSKKN